MLPLDLYARVRFLRSTLHTRPRVPAGTRPSLRPLFKRRATKLQNLGRQRREIAEVWTMIVTASSPDERHPGPLSHCPGYRCAHPGYACLVTPPARCVYRRADPKRSSATTQHDDARLYLSVPIQFRVRQSPITTSPKNPARMQSSSAWLSFTNMSTPHRCAPPELGAGRMDQSGHPEGDNDIVEQHNNPKESALPAP